MGLKGSGCILLGAWLPWLKVLAMVALTILTSWQCKKSRLSSSLSARPLTAYQQPIIVKQTINSGNNHIRLIVLTSTDPSTSKQGTCILLRLCNRAWSSMKTCDVSVELWPKLRTSFLEGAIEVWLCPAFFYASSPYQLCFWGAIKEHSLAFTREPERWLVCPRFSSVFRIIVLAINCLVLSLIEGLP